MRGCVVPVGLELTDIITPKTCSSYIAEIIKYVAYTKQQIPYPYERLKMFVLRRRERQKTREVSSIIAKLGPMFTMNRPRLGMQMLPKTI